MTYRSLNHYLIFIILSQLFLFVNRNINVNGQFIPGPREGQDAVLIGKKLYIIGGRNYGKGVDAISDFFYYDFENGLSNAVVVDLRSQGINLPYRKGHTARVGGINQDLIFIIGGFGYDETNLVYQFNTKTNTLNVPVIQGIGITPHGRRDMNSVSYNNGKIYIFSGRIFYNNGTNTIFNNFDILDTINSVWSVGSLVNAPAPSFYYTATLVNGVIYYIGGLHLSESGQTFTPMTNIYQYDIAKDTWSLKIATGNIPDNRIGHSAVLIGNKICMYGGRYQTTSMPNAIPAVEQIALLDTTTLTWSIPQLKNTNTPKLIDNNIPKIAYHTATALGTRMFLAFGNFTDVIPSVSNENSYYVFDFGQPTVQWFKIASNDIGKPINTKTPNNIPPPTTTPTTTTNLSESSSKPVIIGLSAGLIIIGLGTIAGFLFIYRRMKKNPTEEDPDTSGGVGGGILQISSDNDANNIPTCQQQFNPITAQNFSQNRYSNTHSISPTPTLTQYQGYFPGQEFDNLPSSEQERFSKHSFYYSPGCENPPSSPSRI